MNPARAFWSQWSETLRRYQLHEIAALVLESGGPLKLLGAQALYFSQGLMHNDQLVALAHMLENSEESSAFTAFLEGEQLP